MPRFKPWYTSRFEWSERVAPSVPRSTPSQRFRTPASKIDAPQPDGFRRAAGTAAPRPGRPGRLFEGVVPEATLLAERLSSFREEDLADPEVRSAYRSLRRRQEQLRQAKATASGTNRKYYNPADQNFAKGSPSLYTIYGTAARLNAKLTAAGTPNWLPRYVNPHTIKTCIERVVRREVMFARKKAGVGYKTKKHRTPNSGVPC